MWFANHVFWWTCMWSDMVWVRHVRHVGHVTKPLLDGTSDNVSLRSSQHWLFGVPCNAKGSCFWTQTLLSLHVSSAISVSGNNVISLLQVESTFWKFDLRNDLTSRHSDLRGSTPLLPWRPHRAWRKHEAQDPHCMTSTQDPKDAEETDEWPMNEKWILSIFLAFSRVLPFFLIFLLKMARHKSIAPKKVPRCRRDELCPFTSKLILPCTWVTT